MCLGRLFALQEMQMVIINVLQRYKFEMIPDAGVILPWIDHPPVTVQFPMIHPHSSISKFKFYNRN